MGGKDMCANRRGVDLGHPDLAGKIVAGYDFVNNDSNPQDDQGHGTHVAGIAAAITNNNLGIAGMAWDTQIMPVKVLGADENGTDLWIANGIIWAVDHGAKILNLSLGDETQTQILQNATDYAYSHGSLIVAASGNCGDPVWYTYECATYNPVIYPASNPNVLAVGATKSDDTRASFSSFGSYVDVSAPGESIFSTFWTSVSHGYTYGNGTSMAAPFVSGLAALIWELKPGLSNAQLVNVIISSAKDLGIAGRDDQYGYGRIDANAAMLTTLNTAVADIGEQSPRIVPSMVPGNAAIRPGIVLVRFKSSAVDSGRRSALNRLGVRITGRIDQIGVLELQVPIGKEFSVIGPLQDDPLVEFAEPDYIVPLIQ